MKLVTFSVPAPEGRTQRLGALLDGNQDGRIVDLTNAYAAYLAAETDEPTPRGLAALRTPPDMVGWLRGAHKSREAAEEALAYTRRRTASDPNPESMGGCRLVYTRSEVRLCAPIPRPRALATATGGSLSAHPSARTSATSWVLAR